jgi:SatD family (SatD)
MPGSYVAIIGDAVASRRLAPRRRAALQRELRAALAGANRRFRGVLAARFAVTLGDQFQGLLAGTGAVWEVVHWLRAELAGSEWIIACGRGAVSTPLAASAPEVDGPCFHRARAALDEAKRSGAVLAFGGFDPVVTALGRYYAALYRGWTARQRELATQLRLGDRRRLAARMRVTPSAVSHVASRIGWRLVEAGDAALRARLAGAGGGA